MKTLRIITLCFAFYFGVVAIGVVYLESRRPDHKFPYDQLQIGMHRSRVQTIFQRPPEYHCRFGNSDIWYYASNGPFVQEFPAGTPKSGTTYASANALPDVYDYAQLAFDANGNLVAYTHIGETFYVHYQGGTINGCHFKVLPPGVL